MGIGVPGETGEQNTAETEGTEGLNPIPILTVVREVGIWYRAFFSLPCRFPAGPQVRPLPSVKQGCGPGPVPYVNPTPFLMKKVSPNSNERDMWA